MDENLSKEELIDKLAVAEARAVGAVATLKFLTDANRSSANQLRDWARQFLETGDPPKPKLKWIPPEEQGETAPKCSKCGREAIKYTIPGDTVRHRWICPIHSTSGISS